MPEKIYRIPYPEIKNMGDLLNKNMIEELFHVKVVQSSVPKSNLSAIGSGLEWIFWSKNFTNILRQITDIPFSHEHHLWGTGFISESTKQSSNYCLFKNLNIHSLRGELSRIQLEAKLNRKISVPLGDGGLLADRWLKTKVDKKYSIGIIPHFREKDHPLISQLKAYYLNDIKVINLSDEPKVVVKQIAECETILSSSLHGLIVADSFHIPNRHIILYPFGERIKGDGFKYRDYYSAFGLEDQCLDITTDGIPDIKYIKDNYRLDYNLIEERKDAILEVFPRL